VSFQETKYLHFKDILRHICACPRIGMKTPFL
jgi:hypothetical protein